MKSKSLRLRLHFLQQLQSAGLFLPFFWKQASWFGPLSLNVWFILSLILCVLENGGSSLSRDLCRYPVTVPFTEKSVIWYQIILAPLLKICLGRNRITMGLVWILACMFESVSVCLWEVCVGCGTHGYAFVLEASRQPQIRFSSTDSLSGLKGSSCCCPSHWNYKHSWTHLTLLLFVFIW